MDVTIQKSHKKLAAPAKEVSGVSNSINIEACPALGQRDLHVHYAFWHVEQAYFEILATSYFRTVELQTLMKKNPKTQTKKPEGLVCEFISALPRDKWIKKDRRVLTLFSGCFVSFCNYLCFCLPNIPSASPHSLLSALIAFSPTAAVKVQFFKYFFQTLNCIFLLSTMILSSASNFFLNWYCSHCLSF